MKRREFLSTLAASGAAALTASGQTKRQPLNILFILVDDMGWHDIGPYGNKVIDTPNLDRLASESALFTNGYSACPVCSPSRAAILTGKYPARLHLTDWIPGRKQWPFAKLLTPAFEQQLPLNEITMPKLLDPIGYRTAAMGKWHLGGAGYLPTDQGFNINVGGSDAGHPPTYFGPLDLPNLKLEPGESLTERLTLEGSRFIRETATPFFLYESHYTVHLPLQAKKEVVDKYRARDTGDINPIYCAMVQSADESVGQLLKALDESGKTNNTIVVFFSDNGGVRYQSRDLKPVTNNGPLRAGKGHVYEGGIREPLIIRWPGVTKPGTRIDTPVIGVDFLPTFCDALDISVPKNVDGVSIRPLLEGRSLPERPIFWHYPHYSDQGGAPAGAVRQGNWKLMQFYEDGRLELFNLDNDIGERSNLVRKEPGRAKQLFKFLTDWRNSRNAAMPTLNPDYDPARSSEGLSGYQDPTPPVQA
jgi:arylsulfatase A-like enzyme